MGAHLINGEFQSDKYPTTPRGKVPLSVKDESAQDLLWLYAQRRRAADPEFSDDLEAALAGAGFEDWPCFWCTRAKFTHRGPGETCAVGNNQFWPAPPKSPFKRRVAPDAGF